MQTTNYNELNEIAMKNIAVAQGNKEKNLKERNELSSNIFKRFFNRNKIKELEKEYAELSNKQDEYREEISENETISIIQNNDTKLSNNINELEKKLEKEGLYLTGDLYNSEDIFTTSQVRIEMKDMLYKEYDHIPTQRELLDLVTEKNVVTQLTPDEQRQIQKKLNEYSYATDSNPYSYSTHVYDLYESDNAPQFVIHDDTDAFMDSLKYNAETNKWEGIKYDFEIDNSIDSIQDKYLSVEGSSVKTTIERLKAVENKLDLDTTFQTSIDQNISEANEILSDKGWYFQDNENATSYKSVDDQTIKLAIEPQTDFKIVIELKENELSNPELIAKHIEKNYTKMIDSLSKEQKEYLQNSINLEYSELQLSGISESIEEEQALSNYFESQQQSTSKFDDTTQKLYENEEILNTNTMDLQEKLIGARESLSKSDLKDVDMILKNVDQDKLSDVLTSLEQETGDKTVKRTDQEKTKKNNLTPEEQMKKNQKHDLLKKQYSIDR